MTTTLKELAQAATRWFVNPTIVQETKESVCKLGSADDEGLFYPLIEIDCEQYDQSSRPLAEYIAAASPDVILALIAERDALAADAARYRWLRDNHCCGILETTLDIESGRNPQFEMDAAIDAAMKGQA